MIKFDGKRVTFSDHVKKKRKEMLEVEFGKHKGKLISELTKKQLEDALRAALKYIDKSDENDRIK